MVARNLKFAEKCACVPWKKDGFEKESPGNAMQICFLTVEMVLFFRPRLGYG